MNLRWHGAQEEVDMARIGLGVSVAALLIGLGSQALAEPNPPRDEGSETFSGV